jgi:hypothetical protein
MDLRHGRQYVSHSGIRGAPDEARGSRHDDVCERIDGKEEPPAVGGCKRSAFWGSAAWERRFPCAEGRGSLRHARQVSNLWHFGPPGDSCRALGRITMSAEGRFQIQTGESIEEGEPNLFFDELTPLVAARHSRRELQIFLDTGNNTTFLYPSSRRALSASESTHLTKKNEQMGGAGGTTKRRSEVIPALRFEILGEEVGLKSISLLSKQPRRKSSHRDGVFGADVLEGGFTLDFRSMQFRVHARRRGVSADGAKLHESR